MNKIKGFINKNKVAIVGVVCILVGGALGYSVKKNKQEAEREVYFEATVPPSYPTMDNMNDAVSQFKEYQERNNAVGLFWENDSYSVMGLEHK
jgi:predicted negative regulator of RcsB-dependent stress response